MGGSSRRSISSIGIGSPRCSTAGNGRAATGGGSRAPSMGVKRPSDAAAGAEDASVSAAALSAEPSRLFVVCGRGRKLDELRALFGTCGRIRHLHLALDRSNKSRGFAFLQYEDPIDAARAIERFDQMTLDDGHVLKVTVAKEKPNGKLKRDQHARHEADEKTDGSSSVEEDTAMDGHAPGKRQRSSPPQFTLSPPRSIATPSMALESVISAASDEVTEVRKVKRERIADRKQESESQSEATLLVAAKSTPLTESELLSVADALEDMLTAVDHHSAARVHDPRHLLASYCKAKASRPGPTRLTGLPTISDVTLSAQPQQKSAVNIKVEEATTDMITSSIGSVSLTGTPTMRSPRGVLASATPANQAFTSTTSSTLRSGKPMLRRRRQSIDDSDSSGEDGQDSGGNRRKRSNTTVTPPPQGPPTHFVPSVVTKDNVKMESPARYPAAHGIRAPSTVIDDTTLGRKQCKRQSSDDVHGEAFRSVKQQVTGSGRHSTELNPQAAGSDSVDALSTAFGSLARSRLFFVSTHKFTLQELEAMFSVYGDFEWVQIVKSFGRVKTMAYVKYSQASTAAAVVQSFEGEASTGSHGPGNYDFIKLTFADPMRLDHNPPASVELKPRRDSVDSFALTSELIELDDARRYHERLWLLLLFDRLVPNHVLSSTVTACPGMEFVDIKLSKTSGESQGVAFVKFSTEQHAVDAARELHQTELPVGSGKPLQALVIANPGQFSAAYGNGATDSSGNGRVAGGTVDDVDIGVVEARFAHLMRSNSADHHYSSQPPPDQFQLSRDQSADLPVIGSAYNGPPPMMPMFPALYPSAAHAAYASASMYGGASPSSSGIAFYPAPALAPAPPPPPQYHQSLPPAPVVYDNQPFGFNGWMDPPPTFYHPQYFPLSSAPRRPEMPPHAGLPMRVEQSDRSNDAITRSGITTHGEAKPHQHPLSPSSSDISMGSGESTNGNGGGATDSKPLASSVLVSSARPMDFVAIVSALRDCSGMVAFRKDTVSKSGDGCAYVAQFANETQARAAVTKLDGAMCQGVKLRVGLVSVSGGNKSGKWGGGASGRRKRQRVDARSKGRTDS